MASRETENDAYAKFWGEKQRALWYVMVFSEVVNSETSEKRKNIPQEYKTSENHSPVNNLNICVDFFFQAPNSFPQIVPTAFVTLDQPNYPFRWTRVTRTLGTI